MPTLELVTEIAFKEAITSLALVDLTGTGKDSVVVSTLNGDLRVFDFVSKKKPKLKEIAKATGLPPVAVMGIGDVLGNGAPDFVVAGIDNQLRLIAFLGNKLEVRSVTPVGNLPTALVTTNMMDDANCEVVVATSDKALRCYGWFEVVLDKLAHKVVESPVFSMQPLHHMNMPYSRFVIGDESGHIYLYQYADDRLHEISKAKVGGEVQIVATGNITGDGYDEIATISDDKTLTIFGVEQQKLKQMIRIKTPDVVTAAKIGPIVKEHPYGQVLLSLRDSTILLLEFNGLELVEMTSLKTAKKSVESMIAFGDISDDERNEIVQAVRNNLFVVKLED
ncbi:MAG: hypothetical protein ACFE7R_02695 [Candidatus Hodarchaeota archaeon]